MGISEGIVGAAVILNDKHLVYKTTSSFKVPEEKVGYCTC